MTNRELERLMEEILMEGIVLDWEEGLEPCVPLTDQAFAPSPGYQRSMLEMKKDPLKWRRRRAPAKRALRTVAAVFLALLLTFAAVMMVSPAARAAVIRWVVSWYETAQEVDYVYSGEEAAAALPEYEITALPEGYVEVERVEMPTITDVFYQDDKENTIILHYVCIHDGALSIFDFSTHNVEKVVVHHAQGTLFEPSNPAEQAVITWIDSNKNVQFLIKANISAESILLLAESISERSY